MQLSHLTSLAALASAAAAVTVSFDPGYDNRERALTSVACSDGPNGLLTRTSWRKQGDIPNFPYIGGAQAVAGWSDANCGSCWRLDFEGRSINVLAIDHADAGFNIARAALDKLTNGQAAQRGRIDAQATRVDPKVCGM